MKLFELLNDGLSCRVSSNLTPKWVEQYCGYTSSVLENSTSLSAFLPLTTSLPFAVHVNLSCQDIADMILPSLFLMRPAQSLLGDPLLQDRLNLVGSGTSPLSRFCWFLFFALPIPCRALSLLASILCFPSQCSLKCTGQDLAQCQEGEALLPKGFSQSKCKFAALFFRDTGLR